MRLGQHTHTHTHTHTTLLHTELAIGLRASETLWPTSGAAEQRQQTSSCCLGERHDARPANSLKLLATSERLRRHPLMSRESWPPPCVCVSVDLSAQLAIRETATRPGESFAGPISVVRRSIDATDLRLPSEARVPIEALIALAEAQFGRHGYGSLDGLRDCQQTLARRGLVRR